MHFGSYTLKYKSYAVQNVPTKEEVHFHTRSAPLVFEFKKSEKIFLDSPIKIKRICPETGHLHPSPSVPKGGEIGSFWLFLIFK